MKLKGKPAGLAEHQKGERKKKRNLQGKLFHWRLGRSVGGPGEGGREEFPHWVKIGRGRTRIQLWQKHSFLVRTSAKVASG